MDDDADALALTEGRFRTPPDGRRRLAVNAAAGGAVNILKIGVQLALLPIMAHLLGPAEFGLYALALPTVSFFMTLADGGLGTSLARDREGSSAVWSTAYWVLLLSGIVLAMIVSGLGVVLADLSHEPRLSGIMGFLSISFILITTSVVPSAKLTQQGRLVIFAAADLISTVVGAAVAITMAIRGAGAWSLAAQYVSGFVVRSIILNTTAFVMPTFEFELSALRDHLSTGSAVLGTRLVDFSGRLLENLLYGRTFGAAALGTYTFANQAPRFICEAASSPLWAALYAHALREDRDEVAALHVKLVHLLAALVFLVAFLLSATAPEVLTLLLGPRWLPAAEMLRVLMPFYALQVVATQSGAILVASNRSWVLFWITVALVIGRVAAVLSGAWFGPMGIVYGLGLCNIVYAVLMFRAPARGTGSSSLPLFEGLIFPLILGAAAGLVCFSILHLRTGPPNLPWIVVSVAGGAALYLVTMLTLNGSAFRSEIAALRRVVGRGRYSSRRA